MEPWILLTWLIILTILIVAAWIVGVYEMIISN